MTVIMALMGWATHVLQWPVQRAGPEGKLISQTGRSPDRSLQLDCVKSESLVIADQNAAVNVRVSCTHRPSHHGSGLKKKWVA